MRVLSCLVALALASGAAAQPHNWVPVSDVDGVSASVQKIIPGLAGAAGDAVFFVGAQREVGYGVRAEVEVPFVFVATSDGTDTAVGNPYLGISRAIASGARSQTRVGAGLRPRLSPDPGSSTAAIIGIFSEVERLGMFQNNDLVFTAYADARLDVQDGLGVRVRLAPTVVGDDVLAGYAAQGLVDTRLARLSAGVSGTVYLGETRGGRVFLFGGVAAEGQRGAVRPTAFIRFPLVSPSGFGSAETVLGLGIQAPF